MADSKVSTGSRDDVRIDSSRCLRMRFSESGCCHCVAICPQGAVNVEGSLAINSEKCRGCLLCTSVCPVGALEPGDDFPACLTQLAKVPEPVLGCIRTKECSNATMACLGGLSPEYLLSLIHTLAGTVSLNLSICADCCNSPMISSLRYCLTTLSRAGLTEGSGQIVLVESAQEILFRDAAVNRRSFFKLFSNSMIETAGLALSAAKGQADVQASYGLKRLPARRELLNRTRSRLSPEMMVKCRDQFDFQVTCNENCSYCQGCVAICPTGALQTVSIEDRPLFDQLRCTGCKLCVEFCLDGALQIQPLPA